MYQYTRKINVIKRNGNEQLVNPKKIYDRLEILSDIKPKLATNYMFVAHKTVDSIVDGITTSDLDLIASKRAMEMGVMIHPDYMKLSSRIVVSNHMKYTNTCFSANMALVYNNTDYLSGEPSPLIAKEFYDFVMEFR